MVDLPIYQAEVRFDPVFRRGDSNSDDSLDLSDPINTLDVLFRGQGKIPCRSAADSNDDGTVDLSDPIHSLGFLFLGGSAPPPPSHLSCGPDPTADALACSPQEACR